MLKKLLITLIIFISFQACNVGGSGIWKNENIDKAKRDEIHALNEKLFKSIINNDVAAVRSLMSGKLLEKGSIDLDQLIKRMSSSIEADNYRTLDEYNVKNSTTGIANTLPSGFSGDNDYVIKYQALNKEMYVSLILCGEIAKYSPLRFMENTIVNGKLIFSSLDNIACLKSLHLNITN